MIFVVVVIVFCFFSKSLTPCLESDVFNMKYIGAETGKEVVGFSSSAQRPVFCPTESYQRVKEQGHTVIRGKTLLPAQPV